MSGVQESGSRSKIVTGIVLISIPALAGVTFSLLLFAGAEMGNFIAISYVLWGWIPAAIGAFQILRNIKTASERELKKLDGTETIAERKQKTEL